MGTRQNSFFVEALNQGENRVKTYFTILFTLGFLGCLLAFWIFQYRNEKCVYFGKSCCLTDLKNTAIIPSKSLIYEAVGTGDNKGLALKKNPGDWNPPANGFERLTFPYSVRPGSKSEFTVDLYNTFSTPGNFPGTSAGLSVGFCYITTGTTPGISFYLASYKDATKGLCWSTSINTVTAGLGIFYLNLQPDGNKFDFIISNSKVGMNYILPGGQGTAAPPPIKSTLSPEKSYFQNGIPAGSGGCSWKFKQPDISKTTTHNPFIDFVSTNKLVEDQKSKGSTLRGCVDPSSLELPSCRNPLVDGKGYVVVNSILPQNSLYFEETEDATHNKYSRNCSHTYTPGNLYNIYTPSGGGITSLIPSNSTIGQGYAKDDDKECEQLVNSNKSNLDGSSKSCPQIRIKGESLVNVTGDKKVPGAGGVTVGQIDNLTQNPYFPELLFCGAASAAGSSANLGTMFTYPTDSNSSGSDGEIPSNTQFSQAPNAKYTGAKTSSGLSIVQLGFN